ncbi:MAG: hypothetical protein LBC27_02810 [Spirochaetaceae bacterium]|nr:hypothetical protein [Spirochaetaceae bacterium]
MRAATAYALAKNLSEPPPNIAEFVHKLKFLNNSIHIPLAPYLRRNGRAKMAAINLGKRYFTRLRVNPRFSIKIMLNLPLKKTDKKLNRFKNIIESAGISKNVIFYKPQKVSGI